MSRNHPVIAVTGSLGAGTTTVRRAFEDIFRREALEHVVYVDGNSFRRYDRRQMREVLRQSKEAGRPVSHFGPEVNLLDRLEGLFREYSRTGGGILRRYVDSEELALDYERPVGTFTPWEEIPPDTDLLFYEGLHGGCIKETWSRRELSPSHNPAVIKERHRVKTRPDRGVDVARWVDLLIGVAPAINLEWAQKIHRDHSEKGRSRESITATILRRLPDYVRYITPQFTLTDINFQRVPLVDTSNPFVPDGVPSDDESILVIRFREPERFHFPDLLERIPNAFMSRPNTLVAPGNRMQLAIRVICTPLVQGLIARKQGATD